jgi:hypothetical protein
MSGEQPDRKVRTRGHVIADLGINHVERMILLAGFGVGPADPDYGLDLKMTTFGPGGVAENSTVGFQVKATDSLPLHADGTTIPIRVDARDLRYWLFEPSPVALVVYDATVDRAFWLDVQRYVRDNAVDEDEVGDTVTLRIPVTNVFNPDAARELRLRKEAALGAMGYRV